MCQELFELPHGLVTDLANKYHITRPSVYEAKAFYKLLKDMYNNPKKEVLKTKKGLHELILATRLSCKSSILGISEALKLLNYKCASVGYISQFLNKIAKFTVNNIPITGRKLSILADEIFIGGIPILVIIDAVSHVILAIEISEDRTGESWQKCFKSLIDKGYDLSVVAKDQGTGLANGLNLLNDRENIKVVHQADLFHLIIRFRHLIGYFEKLLKDAVNNEDKCLNVLWNRKTEDAINKQIELSEAAIEHSNEVIIQYEAFEYLHEQLRKSFNPFNSDGSFRTKAVINEDISTVLDLFDEIFENKKLKKAVNFLRKNLAEYYPYVKYLEETLSKYKGKLADDIIKEVCLSYQKGLQSMAIKDYHLSKKVGKQAEQYLWLANAVCANDDERAVVAKLQKSLSEAVRSSSALEAKNSVLRKYFDSSSNQVTQSALNLIAFHMNRKEAPRGKYKGKSPMERHTGIKSEQNYLELLLAS